MARDRDIRNAIQAALVATNQFGNVYLWSLADVSDHSADDTLAATIEPAGWQESDSFDDTVTGLVQIDGSCTITFFSRFEEPQQRDEACERLLEFACNALNGQSLAGVTAPEWTKFTSARWEPASPPERRIGATFIYRYFVENFTSFDESE